MYLTSSQKRILKIAAEHGGRVRFGPGDRKGTRCIGLDDAGVPIVIAYQGPQFFLKSRGLLTHESYERNEYQLTAEGRKLADALET